MRIVLISGKARNGKDQTAQFIKEYLESVDKRVLVTHYADFLKDFCKNNYGYHGVKDEKDRAILQHVGTDIVRKNNPDAWVNMMVELLRGINTEFDFVLIPDVRFHNEISVIKKNFSDVLCLNVVRFNFDNGLTALQKAHASETSLPEYEFDITVRNSGTLDDLKTLVIYITKNYIV